MGKIDDFPFHPFLKSRRLQNSQPTSSMTIICDVATVYYAEVKVVAVNDDLANNCRMKSNSKTSSIYVHMSVIIMKF